MKSKTIKINNRTFIVDFDDKNKPIRIKERKLYAKGTVYESWYNASYWHSSHHNIGAKSTIVAKILEQV